MATNKTRKTRIKTNYANPRERFLGLASKRVQNVLKTIRLLGNCSNKNSYEYTPTEYQKMVKAIETALDVMKAKFTQAPGSTSKETFTFTQ